VLPLARIAKEIGIVLSGANALYAPIALRRDAELEAREEDLVLIYDERLRDYYMLGVLRWVTRYEPFLRRATHNVYIEYPEALNTDMVMPFTNALVEIYAGICDDSPLCGKRRGIDSNIYAPTPSSKVYKLTDADPLTKYLAISKAIHVGVHKYSKWRLPLDTHWVPYHIGVFGATGTGKSRLVLKLVEELSKAGFSLIVFDHSGVDYVPAAQKLGWEVVDANEIVIPPLVFASTIAELMGLSSSSTLRDYVDLATVCYDKLRKGEANAPNACFQQVSGIVRSGSNKAQKRYEHWDKQLFRDVLATVAKRFGARDHTVYKLSVLLDYYVPDYVFETMNHRSVEPRELVERALEKRVVVVDLSSERNVEVKRAIVASIASSVWSVVYERLEPVNLGLVIDEAQNYACDHCGNAARELETIAREGRKWGYFIVVASQRIARDIRPGIRSNLGTVFFSRLQSRNDLQELAGYLDLGRVTEASLAMLSRREFYVAGLMNPLRRPLLLRVDEVTLQ